MNENKKSQSGERERFWEAYGGCAEENMVAPDRSRYYVKRVKEFVDFLPDKRLEARSGKDIEAFLAALTKRQGIADWQVRQKGMMGSTALHPSYDPEFTCPICSKFLGLNKE